MNKFGIGVVIRNNQGLVITSLSKQLLQAYYLEKIEPLAAAKALQFASVIGRDQSSCLAGWLLGDNESFNNIIIIVVVVIISVRDKY